MAKAIFEASKIKIAIAKQGSTFLVFRRLKNKFGELSGDEEQILKFKGLYHEKNGYVKLSHGDAATYRTKKEPTILCLKSDASLLKIGDKIMFEENVNNKIYFVSAVTNVQELGEIFDVSMEEQVRNIAEN